MEEVIDQLKDAAEKMDPRVCRSCEKVNTLDQWYELPNHTYLVCSTCASTDPYARPIHINTIAERLLEAYSAVKILKTQNEELNAVIDGVPGLEKQLRRLVRAIERGAKATEQMGFKVTEMTENLSPRWLFHVEPDQKDAAHRLMVKLSQEAGPGAILEVSKEEHQLLHRIVKLSDRERKRRGEEPRLRGSWGKRT